MFGFFKKNNNSTPKSQKLPGPQTMPDEAGRTLVADLKQDPNWVWNLKAVVMPKEENGVFSIRIFDEKISRAKGVQIKDYTSLNDHPTLILFDGWINKKTRDAEIKSRQ